MTFFNKKEEVIEIQLTSYGKYKLSQGKLKPKFYAFFDDDICYDPQYTGITLTTDEEYTEQRIQDETPSLRSPTTLTGLEQLLKRTKEIQNSGYDQKKYFEVVDDVSSTEEYSLPIGSGEPSNVLAPAWDINLRRGVITNGAWTESSMKIEGSYAVPTFNASVEYTTHIYTEEDIYGAISLTENLSAEQNYSQTMGQISAPSNGYLINYFPDGTVVIVNDNYIILDVVEKNVRGTRDNFVFSVQQIEDAVDEDNTPSIIHMSFVKRPNEITDDGILLDESEIEKIDDKEIDETYVEYYMDVLADSEIDDDAVCDYIATTETDQIRWSRVLSCSGLTEGEGSILYSDEELVECED